MKSCKIDEPAITNLKSLLLNTDWSYLNQTSENLQFDALVEKITEYLDICAINKNTTYICNTEQMDDEGLVKIFSCLM